MTSNVWEVVRKQDGTFEILHNGKSLRSSIPDKWLEAELGTYGFCGPEYKDIRRQLEQSGTARVVL